MNTAANSILAETRPATVTRTRSNGNQSLPHILDSLQVLSPRFSAAHGVVLSRREAEHSLLPIAALYSAITP